MPSRYHDIQALLGTSFTLGFGDIHTTFTVVRNEETKQLMLQLDTGLNTGAMPIRTSYKAISDDELCNLKTTREWLDALETSVREYVNEKVADITGGTSGGNVMLLPVSINVNDVTEATYNITMGTLARDKFIDRVIFEVLTPFSKADGSTLEFSVGTDEDPELLVPKTGISSLQSTLVVDICKTITADTTIKVFGYMATEEPEEPDDPYDQEFVQRVDNNHESVSVSMTSDANDDIISITLSAGALRVANTGATDEPLDADRIWDRFYHTGGQGTGLGLALARAVAERYGLALTYTFEGGEHVFRVGRKT